MPAGFEVWNDAGIPQTIEGSINWTLIEKGTVSIGSNAAATGTTGSRLLPAKPDTYLVFIRCNGNAALTGMGTDRFGWHMAQGTTSFEYWAYARGAGGGNVGLQVFNADGGLRWDITNRPMQISSVIRPDGGLNNPGPSATINLVTGNAYGIPAGHACLLSDPGLLADVYFIPGGYPLTANMRFYPMINTAEGGIMRMNYARRYANLTASGGPPSGSSYVGSHSQNPSWIITAPPL